MTIPSDAERELLAHAQQQIDMSVKVVADNVEIQATLKVILDCVKGIMVASGTPQEEVDAQCEASLELYRKEFYELAAARLDIPLAEPAETLDSEGK